jgi:hypothetical protein
VIIMNDHDQETILKYFNDLQLNALTLPHNSKEQRYLFRAIERAQANMPRPDSTHLEKLFFSRLLGDIRVCVDAVKSLYDRTGKQAVWTNWVNLKVMYAPTKTESK